MKFTFDIKAKEALNELIKNSSENYIRIKVFYGCGRPAYDIYADFKGEEDEEVCFYAKNLSVKKVTPLSNGKHLRFDLELPKVRGQALYFNHGELYEQYKNIEKINVVGKFSINVFNNFESVNIIIEGIK